MLELLRERVPVLGELLVENKKGVNFPVKFILTAFHKCALELQSQFLLLLPKMRTLGRNAPFSWSPRRAELGPMVWPCEGGCWQSPFGHQTTKECLTVDDDIQVFFVILFLKNAHLAMGTLPF